MARSTSRRAIVAAAAGLTLVAVAGAAQARQAGPFCPHLEMSADPASPVAGELIVRFMGATSLLFDDGVTQILVDGFFSRPPALRALVGTVRPHCGRIGEGLRAGGISDRLRLLLVAHAHVDHALDAPEIARRSGADLVGSSSVANVARGHFLPERQIKPLSHCAPCSYGDFKVTAISTRHSIPNVAPGRIRGPVPSEASARRYRASDSQAFLIEHRGRRILVYPSAAYRKGWMRSFRADVIFLGTTWIGRKPAWYARGYWAEVVEAVGGRVVYPIHWDDLSRPLGLGLRPLPLDKVGRANRRLARLAEACGVEFRELRLWEPVKLERSGGLRTLPSPAPRRATSACPSPAP